MSGVFQNIDPPTPPPPGECVVYGGGAFGAGGEDTLAGWRGGNILEDAKHSFVLYICKYFVDSPQGSQRDVVYLGWLVVSSYMSSNAGGSGVSGSRPKYSCAHVAQINLLSRSNSIFNQWFPPLCLSTPLYV